MTYYDIPDNFNKYPLERYEQAAFFIMLMHLGEPSWADDIRDCFARLMNISIEEADKAFDEAVEKGLIRERKTEQDDIS